MKAVLATLGCIVPGFGSISGFLVGTGIDLIYGRDIDKLIDKVADIFEEKKVYVFDCPNCGKSWATTVDLKKDDSDLDDEIEDILKNLKEYERLQNNNSERVDEDLKELFYDESEAVIVNDNSNGSEKSSQIVSSHSVNMLLIEVLFDVAKTFNILSKDFYDAVSKVFIITNDEYEKLDRISDVSTEAKAEMKSQLKNFYADVITHISQACRGTMDSPVLVERSAVNLPFSMEVHGVYPIDLDDSKKLVVGVIRTGILHTGDRVSLDQGNNALIESISMFGKLLDQAEAGDVCAIIVPSDFINDNDMRVFYKIPQLIHECGNLSDCSNNRQKEITEADEEYMMEYKTCLEEGATISHKERRLLNHLRDSLGISPERGIELETLCLLSTLSYEEKEYVAEVKACLADGSVMSDRERRLLNRLAVSLNIDEERARELEAKL